MSKLDTRPQIIGAVVIVMLAFAGTVAADTIYLKNGRTIQSSTVRIEGELVIFFQYSGEVSIPLALVDRIEKDGNVEPEAMPAASPPSSPSAGATEPAGAGAEAGSGEPTEGEPGAETPEDPTQTRPYWQDKVRAIVDQQETVRLEIEDLRRTERAFLFSRRSTTETRLAIEAAQERLVELEKEMDELRAEARRAQIPAGWLRLPPARQLPELR